MMSDYSHKTALQSQHLVTWLHLVPLVITVKQTLTNIDQIFNNIQWYCHFFSTFTSVGQIQIQVPNGNTSITSDNAVMLQCNLESLLQSTTIEYVWSRETGSISQDSQISDGMCQVL